MEKKNKINLCQRGAHIWRRLRTVSAFLSTARVLELITSTPAVLIEKSILLSLRQICAPLTQINFIFFLFIFYFTAF